MPFKGYQTLTIRQSLHDRIVSTYEEKKRDLIMEDIKSYSAYAQKLLGYALEQDTMEGRFRTLSFEDSVVWVRDYFRQKDAEIEIREKSRVYCRLDDTGNCDHVGFVLANPLVIKRAKELGVKLRKA